MALTKDQINSIVKVDMWDSGYAVSVSDRETISELKRLALRGLASEVLDSDVLNAAMLCCLVRAHQISTSDKVDQSRVDTYTAANDALYAFMAEVKE
jgi:hypothetical protein